MPVAIERSPVGLGHRPHQGEPEGAVRQDVVRRRQWLAKRVDQPGRDERRRAAGERQRHAVGHAHRGHAAPEREDLDEHRALQAQREAQRDGQQDLPEREPGRRPVEHQPQGRDDQGHRGRGEDQHQPAPAGAVGEPATERLGDQHDDETQRRGQEEVAAAGGRTAPLDDVGEGDVVGGVRRGDDAERLEHGPPVGRQRGEQRRTRSGRLYAFRRLGETAAQEPAEHAAGPGWR